MAAVDTIIVGGGIAGLACARRLHEAGRDFRLITDRLGGRMHAGPDPLLNFGATYITADYRNVLAFVRPGRRLTAREASFEGEGGCFPLLRGRTLRHGCALARLLVRLIEFRGRFNRFRAACPRACQAGLLRQDPQLERLVQQPAAEFVSEQRFELLTRDYIDSVLHATLFTGVEHVNAFYLLAVLLPLVVPTYLADFSGTVGRMAEGFRERIEIGRVLAVETTSRGTYRVATAAREFEARNLVVATPTRNTRAFFPEADDSQEHGLLDIPMLAVHVRGRRHPRYAPGRIAYLEPGGAVTSLLPLSEGTDLLFARSGGVDLARYYEEHTVAAAVHWKTAVQLSCRTWRPLTPRPGLHIIGDYNICGLEDSYLTGLYAANRILA